MGEKSFDAFKPPAVSCDPRTGPLETKVLSEGELSVNSVSSMAPDPDTLLVEYGFHLKSWNVIIRFAKRKDPQNPKLEKRWEKFHITSLLRKNVASGCSTSTLVTELVDSHR